MIKNEEIVFSDKDKETILGWSSFSIIGVGGLLLVSLYLPSVAFAQTSSIPPTPMTPQAQQIISKGQSACATVLLTGPSTAPSDVFSFLAPSCVSTYYASTQTVVLNGDLLISAAAGNIPNQYIWQAVNDFKQIGYSITSVELSGQGSQGNPHQWYIVMSK